MNGPQMKAHIDRFRALMRPADRGLFAIHDAKGAAPEAADLYVYDAIGGGFFGGVSAQDVVSALAGFKKNGVKRLNVYINSPGGNVFDGVAIYNAIHRFEGEKVVCIDGLAASAASYVAMAGSRIDMAANAMMMIHDPWGGVIGTADDMRKCAESLDKVKEVIVATYAARTKQSAEDLQKWMAEETWMKADEAKDRGFCDSILAAAEGETTTEDKAHPLLSKFTKTPEDLRAAARSAAVIVRSMQRRLNNLRDREVPAPKKPGTPGRTTKQ